MVSVLLVIVTIGLFIYRAYKWATYYPPGFPPGPPRLPILGSYPFFLFLNKDKLHLAALTLSRWYKSKLIGFYLGGALVTVINDYEGIKEAFYRSEFDGKPHIYTVFMREPKEQVRGN